jgi:hypothetical protein
MIFVLCMLLELSDVRPTIHRVEARIFRVKCHQVIAETLKAIRKRTA